jgi:hypothetical protein
VDAIISSLRSQHIPLLFNVDPACKNDNELNLSYNFLLSQRWRSMLRTSLMRFICTSLHFLPIHRKELM